MKKTLTLAMAITIFLFCLGNLFAEDKPQKVWVNPQRYEIVLMKPTGGQWASGFNEVILLDREEGRTWTLKSKNLKDGWIPMPLKGETEKKAE
jgi:hypothetical protein